MVRRGDGDIPPGNGGIEGDSTAWETGGRDGNGEVTGCTEVVDVCGGL